MYFAIIILRQMDQKKDVFDHYGVDQYMEVMFIATAPAGRRQGVGVLLVTGAMEVARSKGIPVCSAIFSSVGSQRIGAILKWDQLFVGNVSDFEFKEQEYTRFPAQDQKLILMACKL
jgi:GNAT superfamily N-acetyltransferase